MIATYQVRLATGEVYPACFPDSPEGRDLVAKWVVAILAEFAVELGGWPWPASVTIERR